MLPHTRWLYLGLDQENKPMFAPAYFGYQQESTFIPIQTQITSIVETEVEYDKDKLISENVQLRADLQITEMVAQSYCANLSNEIESLRMACEDLQDEKRTLTYTRTRQTNEIKQLSNKLQELENTKDGVENTSCESQKTDEETQRKIQELQSKCAEYETKIQEHEAALIACCKNDSQHTVNDRYLTDVLKESNQHMKANRLQMVRLRNDVSRAHRQLAHYSHKIRILTTELTTSRSSLRDLEFQLQQTNAALTMRDENLDKMRESLNQKQKEYEELLAVKQNCKKCVALEQMKQNEIANQKYLADTRTRFLEMETQEKILRITVQEVTRSIGTLEKQIQSLKLENRRLMSCMHDLELQVKLDKDEIAQLREKLDRGDEEKRKLEQEVKCKIDTAGDTKEKIIKLNETIAQQDTDLKSKSSWISQQEERISELKQQLQDAEEQIASLKNQVATLENDTSRSETRRVKRYSRDQLLSYSSVSPAMMTKLPASECLSGTQQQRPVADLSEWFPRCYQSCDEELESPRPPRRIGMTGDDIYKKFRSILNKLTPEKFDKLLGQIKALQINTETLLEGIAQILVDKASLETHFAELYVKLCVALSDLKAQDSSLNKKIISYCESQFKSMNSEDENRNKLVQKVQDSPSELEYKIELEEYDFKERKRKVGFCTFLGQLYKKDILSFKCLEICINDLASLHEECSLECLCKLLETVGPTLDAHGDKKTLISQIFTNLKTKVEEIEATNSRLYYMVMDLRETFVMGWTPRGPENKPVTLAEIDLEVANDLTYSPSPSCSQPFRHTSCSPHTESGPRQNLYSNSPRTNPIMLGPSRSPTPSKPCTTPRSTSTKSQWNRPSTEIDLMPHWMKK